MKKVLSIFLILAVCFCFSGCSSKPSTIDIAKDILYCFDNRDDEGLKRLFCEAISKDSLNSQIETAFDIYDGKSVSYSSISTPSQKSIRNGETALLQINPLIRHIETDTGMEYAIKFYTYRINKKNPEKVGVYFISLYTYNDNKEMVLLAEIGKAI